MPIYEYECKNCHHTFDLLQKISDQPAKQCPVCLEHSVARLVSPSGFHLKGTGWYVTDFKDKKTKSTDKNSESKAPETSETKDSAKQSKKETGDKSE